MAETAVQATGLTNLLVNIDIPDERHVRRRYMAVCSSMKDIASKMRLGEEIYSKAEILFDKCYKAGISTNKKPQLVAAGCIAISCKTQGAPVAERDLVGMCGHKKSYFRRFVKEAAYSLEITKAPFEDRFINLLANLAVRVGLDGSAAGSAYALFANIRHADETAITNHVTAAMALLYIVDPSPDTAKYGAVSDIGCSMRAVRRNVVHLTKVIKKHGIKAEIAAVKSSDDTD